MKGKSHKDGKQLLLIDDDPNLILLVKDYLEFQGYQVITAENGQEALKILDQTTPDLIICDVMMPEMDGYALVEEVRKDPLISWIPVLFLSAKGQSQDRIKGLNTGADVYMVKPFEPEELAAQIASCLQQVSRLRSSQAKSSLGQVSKIQLSANVDLTPTEVKVIQLVAQGMGNREIAEQLCVSQRTIESHVSNMLNKTNFNNRTELARWAIESNLT